MEAASAIDIPPEASEPGTEALAFPLPEEEEVRQALLEQAIQPRATTRLRYLSYG